MSRRHVQRLVHVRKELNSLLPVSIDTNTTICFDSADKASRWKLCNSSYLKVVKIEDPSALFATLLSTWK